MAITGLPTDLRRLPSGVATLAIPALLIGIVVFLVGSNNPVTPAGYVGYLTRGAIFGHERFVGLQTGPTSSGRGWLLDVINVSVTPHVVLGRTRHERSPT